MVKYFTRYKTMKLRPQWKMHGIKTKPILFCFTIFCLELPRRNKLNCKCPIICKTKSFLSDTKHKIDCRNTLTHLLPCIEDWIAQVPIKISIVNCNKIKRLLHFILFNFEMYFPHLQSSNLVVYPHPCSELLY